MKSTWHQYGYNYRDKFSDIRDEWSRGFEHIYFSEQDGAYYLIYDGTHVCDFMVALADSDGEIEEIQSENFIQIIEFKSAKARLEYRLEKYLGDIPLKFIGKAFKTKDG